MFVKSKEVYSPQNFCDTFYNVCPIFDGAKGELEKWLKKTHRMANNFALDEIEKVICSNTPVVLVDTTFINDFGEICHEYRWFQIPYKPKDIMIYFG